MGTTVRPGTVENFKSPNTKVGLDCARPGKLIGFCFLGSLFYFSQ